MRPRFRRIEDVPPPPVLPEHDWQPRERPGVEEPHWCCTRCGSRVLDIQKPNPGRCRGR